VADRILMDAGVALTPGNDFGTHLADRHVRISYTTSMDEIEEGLERLGALLRR
jgi:aspartate/methionine/tyrosine aminotransferase